MSLLVVTCAGLLSEKIANKITSNEKAARIINRKRKGHYGL
jgi:L-2-hydroxyglutarate oxidase LhgO